MNFGYSLDIDVTASLPLLAKRSVNEGRAIRRSIIVTDLTRFSTPEKVCTAGADRANGDCIRPMPYLESAVCRRLNILPGAILAGDFKPTRGREGPHQEDFWHHNLKYQGRCTSSQLRTALEYGLFDSVEQGFEFQFAPQQKHIPFDQDVMRSIITVPVAPRDVEIVTGFDPGKIKLNFTDSSRHEFRYVAITDLGFHDYAQAHHAANELAALVGWIRSQEDVLLRLGLSRRYQAGDGRDGYWLQANGIYTFPDCHPGIRSYGPSGTV